MELAPVEDLDFAAMLRPDDRIVVGQATSEPLTLTRRLMQSPALPDGCAAFLGPVYSDTFDAPPPGGLRFESYGAMGEAARLARAGRLAILPMHYSALCAGFGDGTLRADCVLLQAAPARDGKGFSLGLASDYAIMAARHARIVIVEVNERVPRTAGGAWPEEAPVHVAVRADHAPLEMRLAQPGPVEERIAANVAALIPDRAALQFGVGAIPQAVAASLRQHRDLGIHSGVVFDGVLDLIESGAVTNAAKEFDAGVSVTGLLTGSRRLYDFAEDGGPIRLMAPSHTHSTPVLGRLSRFCAVNSAVEVDLTGQVNSETAGRRHVGAVGGQVDFVRGANASPGGRAIIALPSTAANGAISRIVPSVATVTCARPDVDAIVTEWGVAELRGQPLAERARRMIAIAAPQFREGLSRMWAEGRGDHDD